MYQPKIYLAGPDVFLPNSLEIGARKKDLCAQFGFEGLYPLDNELCGTGAPSEVAMAIFRGNRDMMRAADAVIANLTPFRGPSADVGTVFEIGMMAGLGKAVFGYSNAELPFTERTVQSDPASRFDAGRGGWVDGEGMAIEGFGLVDNLMIDGALSDGGGRLVTVACAWPERFTGLDGFRACLEQARQHFGLDAVRRRA